MEKNNNYNSTKSSIFEFTVKQLGEPTLVPPAEETPKGGLYFLSNLDQNFQVLVQIVYFFKSKEKGNEKVVEVIKEALSKVLVHYYPMAGRLKVGSDDGKLVVDCTGEGVAFVEAEANCTIEDILLVHDNTMVNYATLKKLVYDFGGSKNLLDMPLFIAQVTKFQLGGFVLGVCLNHCLYDGLTTTNFINSWGKFARNFPMKVPPSLDRTILKARNPPKIEFPHHEFAEIQDLSRITNNLNREEEMMIYKSFSFSPEKLELLKKKAMEDGVLRKCTTFEALSAFVWKARTQSLKLQPNQQTRLLFFVNGRSRFNPQLPENFFGNAVVLANTICSVEKLVKNSLSFAVELVQEAIQLITNDYMRSVIDYLEVTKANACLNATDLLISSWNRLSFHDANFGWGWPVFVGRANPPRKELALFLSDGKERNNISVLLGLPASSMKIFQKNLNIYTKSSKVRVRCLANKL